MDSEGPLASTVFSIILGDIDRRGAGGVRKGGSLPLAMVESRPQLGVSLSEALRRTDQGDRRAGTCWKQWTKYIQMNTVDTLSSCPLNHLRVFVKAKYS